MYIEDRVLFMDDFLEKIRAAFRDDARRRAANAEHYVLVSVRDDEGNVSGAIDPLTGQSIPLTQNANAAEQFSCDDSQEHLASITGLKDVNLRAGLTAYATDLVDGLKRALGTVVEVVVEPVAKAVALVTDAMIEGGKQIVATVVEEIKKQDHAKKVADKIESGAIKCMTPEPKAENPADAIVKVFAEQLNAIASGSVTNEAKPSNMADVAQHGAAVMVGGVALPDKENQAYAPHSVKTYGIAKDDAPASSSNESRALADARLAVAIKNEIAIAEDAARIDKLSAEKIVEAFVSGSPVQQQVGYNKNASFTEIAKSDEKHTQNGTDIAPKVTVRNEASVVERKPLDSHVSLPSRRNETGSVATSNHSNIQTNPFASTNQVETTSALDIANFNAAAGIIGMAPYGLVAAEKPLSAVNALARAFAKESPARVVTKVKADDGSAGGHKQQDRNPREQA